MEIVRVSVLLLVKGVIALVLWLGRILLGVMSGVVAAAVVVVLALMVARWLDWPALVVGSLGLAGGQSVGVSVARRVLEASAPGRRAPHY